MARKTGFKPAFVEVARKACENGATDNDLAELFDVSSRTISRWQIEYPDFCQALKQGKDVADERVHRSLYHRAVGYSHEAVKIFMPAGASRPVYAPYTEHVPPDVTACIFWLKNRRPADWREKVEHQHGPSDAFLELMRRVSVGEFSKPVDAKVIEHQDE